MSNKTNNLEKDLKTTTQGKEEAVKALSGKIDGFTDEMLKELSLEDLKMLQDNLKVIEKETGSKVRSNVATEVLKYFIDNKITELPTAQVHDLVRVNNVLNYFDLKAGQELPTTREAINAYILLKRLTSNNEDSQAERQTKWLKRGKAYTDSHLIGTSNSGSLFKSKAATHYFIEQNGVIVLTEKEPK